MVDLMLCSKRKLHVNIVVWEQKCNQLAKSHCITFNKKLSLTPTIFCNAIKIKKCINSLVRGGGGGGEIKMAFNVWTFLISTPINDAIKIIHKITPQK